MGQIFFFDVASAMQTHNLHHFVETGTGCGFGLDFARSLPFRSIWTCEIEPIALRGDPVLVDDLLADGRVALFQMPSVVMLGMLGRIPQSEPILFWLDAHFPGADFGSRGYADERDETIRLPLKGELTLIRQHRPLAQDVIIIDDARIWLDGPFESGPIHHTITACRPAKLGIGFVYDLFAATHRIDILSNDNGYIVLSPLSVSGDCAVRQSQEATDANGACAG